MRELNRGLLTNKETSDMDRDITYTEAGESTDADTLVEYCIQGAMDSADNYGGKHDEWRDGAHLVKSYLDHNTVAGKEVLQEVAYQLSDWLRSQLNSPIPFNAKRFEEDERTVLVRREERPSERYCWVSPVDASAVGAGCNQYVRFINREEAISEAKRLGYQVLDD